MFRFRRSFTANSLRMLFWSKFFIFPVEALIIPLIFFTQTVTSLRVLQKKSNLESSYFALVLWVPVKFIPSGTLKLKCYLTLCSMFERESLRLMMSSYCAFLTPFIMTSFSLTDKISTKGMQRRGFSGKLLELSLSLYISKASLFRIIHRVRRFFYLSICLQSSPSCRILLFIIC